MPAAKKRRYPRPARYLDSSFDERDGVAEERNGNLTLVTDRETGQSDWYAPHEIEEG